MMARLWRGWADPSGALDYERHLRDETLSALTDIAGYRGAYVLRRDTGGELEFVVITFSPRVPTSTSRSGRSPWLSARSSPS